MKDWISHVKEFAKKHDITYRDALRHPNIKNGYKKRTKEGRGSIISGLINRSVTPLNEDIYDTLARFINCGIRMRRDGTLRHPTDAELLSHLLDTLLINGQIHTRRGLNIHSRDTVIQNLSRTLENNRLLQRYCEQVLEAQFDTNAPYYMGMYHNDDGGQIVEAEAHYA